MLNCPLCKTKVGVQHMRTHAGKIIYRQYRCRPCGLVFNTQEIVVRNAAILTQLTDVAAKQGLEPAVVIERVFGKPGFKYKNARLKPGS